jgi:hypothetical protein
MKLFIKIISIILFVVLALGVPYGIYLYNKPHRNIAQAKTDESIQAEVLFQKFSQNENQANQKYLDKVIEVEGKIKEIKQENKQVVLILESGDEMFGVNCTLDEKASSIVSTLKVGNSIKLKGLCTGMTMDVVLIQCSP